MTTYRELNETNEIQPPLCGACGKVWAEITMWGYAEANLELCTSCALQLGRKLLEDICVFHGGRHG